MLNSGKNFTSMSKMIQSNRLDVQVMEQTIMKQIEQNRYIYSFPAKIGMAKLHRHASKFGFKKDLKGQIPTVCPCCNMRMDNQQIPLCYSTSENSIEIENNYQQFKLTPGIAMFFSIIKNEILYVLLMLLICMFMSYAKIACQFDDIIPNLFNIQECNFKQTKPDQNIIVQNILYLMSLILAIIFFIISKKIKNSWHKTIYLKNQSENSYAIKISNIPILDFPKNGQNKQNKSQFFYRQHLQQFLQKRIQQWVNNRHNWNSDSDSNQKDFLQVLNNNQGEPKSKSIIQSISLCYNLNRLEVIDQTKEELIKQYLEQEDDNNQLIQQVNDGKKEDNRFATIPKKIQFVNDCRIVLNNQYASDNSFLFNLTHFVGHAFVSFQYQHYKQFFIDQYNKNSKAFFYNNKYLQVAPAAHPNQINWKNIRFSRLQRSGVILTLLLFIFLIIAFQIALLFGLKMLPALLSKININVLNNKFISITLEVITIFITNQLILHVIQSFIARQKQQTKQNEAISHIYKNAVFVSINTIVTLFILSKIAVDQSKTSTYANLFITETSILELLYQLVQPVHIFRQIRRWWRYRKLQNESTCQKFQFQLNQQFEYPVYSVQSRYSYYIYKIFIAFFFIYKAPLGLVITFVTFLFMYWIDKINLFRRSSLYYHGNIIVSNSVLNLLQLSLVIYAFSVLIYVKEQNSQTDIFLTIGLILSVIFVLFIYFAPSRLLSLIFGRQNASGKYIYDDCVSDGKFSETYWSTNPATFTIQQSSVTNKQLVTNPALLKNFANPKEYKELI